MAWEYSCLRLNGFAFEPHGQSKCEADLYDCCENELDRVRGLWMNESAEGTLYRIGGKLMRLRLK